MKTLVDASLDLLKQIEETVQADMTAEERANMELVCNRTTCAVHLACALMANGWVYNIRGQ